MRWRERLQLRVYHAIFGASVAVSVRMSDWIDQLEPPPPAPSADAILARIANLEPAAPPPPDYRTTEVDRFAADLVDRHDEPLFVVPASAQACDLYTKEKATKPCFAFAQSEVFETRSRGIHQ